MEQSVKVWFYLKKNEANEEGRCPVMARLTVGNTASVFSMKLTAPVSLWTSGRAQGKSAEAGRINRQLDEVRASVLSIYRERSAIRNDITADDIKHRLLGMNDGQETLLCYFRSFIEHFAQRVNINRTVGTLNSYRIVYKRLSGFLQQNIVLRIFHLRHWTNRSSTNTICTCVPNVIWHSAQSACRQPGYGQS